MRPDPVIFLTPVFDDFSGFGQASEPMLIQAFSPELFVEAFDVAVLHWLARIDENVFYPMVIRPCVHNIAGELRAIVSQDFFRQAHPSVSYYPTKGRLRVPSAGGFPLRAVSIAWLR